MQQLLTNEGGSGLTGFSLSAMGKSTEKKTGRGTLEERLDKQERGKITLNIEQGKGMTKARHHFPHCARKKSPLALLLLYPNFQRKSCCLNCLLIFN